MIKETITYVDYNGHQRTEDFFFNLNEAEVLEMEMSMNGGFSEKIKQIIAAEDTATLIQIFKDLILKAYGVKTLDGRGFKKTQDLRDEFVCTEAYSKLFMKLATDADAATKFVNGIAPAQKSDKVALPASDSIGEASNVVDMPGIESDNI